MSEGVIVKLTNNDYNVSCVMCGTQEKLLMYPHRLKDNKMVGFVYVCHKHEKEVQDMYIHLYNKNQGLTKGEVV